MAAAVNLAQRESLSDISNFRFCFHLLIIITNIINMHTIVVTMIVILPITALHLEYDRAVLQFSIQFQFNRTILICYIQ